MNIIERIKTMPMTGTATELSFAAKMLDAGWQVYKNGFPDFLCVKDGKAILVEVKGTKRERLKRHQRKMLELLTTFKEFQAFTWSPKQHQLRPFNKGNNPIKLYKIDSLGSKTAHGKSRLQLRKNEL